MQAADEARKSVDSHNFLEVRYEDLCANKAAVYDGVLDFSDLQACDRLATKLESTSLQNTNDKWRNDLSSAQQEILTSVLKETRAKYGYRDA